MHESANGRMNALNFLLARCLLRLRAILYSNIIKKQENQIFNFKTFYWDICTMHHEVICVGTPLCFITSYISTGARKFRRKLFRRKIFRRRMFRRKEISP